MYYIRIFISYISVCICSHNTGRKRDKMGCIRNCIEIIDIRILRFESNIQMNSFECIQFELDFVADSKHSNQICFDIRFDLNLTAKKQKQKHLCTSLKWTACNTPRGPASQCFEDAASAGGNFTAGRLGSSIPMIRSLISPGHESDSEKIFGNGGMPGLDGLVELGRLPGPSWGPPCMSGRLGVDLGCFSTGATGFPSNCSLPISGREWRDTCVSEGGRTITRPTVSSNSG